jgi:outer membrane protein assembly factor BamB
MPSLTRRQLIAGSTAVAAVGYGGYRLVKGAPDADLGSWTPEQGTWPLKRYDTANTAHNPHASPPRETPKKRELGSIASDGAKPAYFFPLAGPDRLVVYGDELAAYADGTITTFGEAETYFAGFSPDGRLHVTTEYDTATNLVGYDGNQEMYRYSVSGHPEGLTVGRDEVYVGTLNDGVVAYEPDCGRDWVVAGETCALADDRLYTVGGRNGTLAYREQAPPGRWLSAGPGSMWTAPSVRGDSHPPAIADGRLVVGTYGLHHSELAAFDAETSEALWEPKSFADDGAADVSTPAVAGRNGYVAAGIDGLDAGFIARYNLESGDEVWRDETDWYASNPVLAGDTLVVAGDVRVGSEAPTTTVRAYDTESGEVLWTVTFSGEGGTNLALVGERVLATAGSSLYELA